MKVRIYRICKDNPLPTQSNSGDAGWDVYAAEDCNFSAKESKLVPLGIIAEAPKGYHFKLCLRSSMGWKKGFRLCNGVGIIDHEYSHEKDQIFLAAEWTGVKGNGEIKKGDRVGQLILEKNNDIEWEEQSVPDFRDGKSRGGFGSTGD